MLLPKRHLSTVGDLGQQVGIEGYRFFVDMLDVRVILLSTRLSVLAAMGNRTPAGARTDNLFICCTSPHTPQRVPARAGSVRSQREVF